MPTVTINASPQPIAIDPARTAVILIDMQRDFLEPGGFGESLGNDVTLLQAAVEPCRLLLNCAREQRLLVIHTREGHRPDLSDCPANKRWRSQQMGAGIGAIMTDAGYPKPFPEF